MSKDIIFYETLRTISTAFVCSMGLYSVYHLGESFPIFYCIIGVVAIYFPTIIYGLEYEDSDFDLYDEEDNETFSEVADREEKKDKENSK